MERRERGADCSCPVDEITTYVLFVASDEAAYSTGDEFVADRGFMLGPVDHTLATATA